MNEVIIDTNVIVVANRQNVEVVKSCADACVKFLIHAQSKCVVLLDTGDEVRGEYARALQTQRPYQLGAQFLIHVLRNRWNPKFIRAVDILKRQDGEFVDFPVDAALKKFDRADRKFAALSKNSGVPVTNAIDSDWANFREPLKVNGIEVNFLCGYEKKSWF